MSAGHVVIVGANGFLGRYLCRHFVRRGREVVAVARRKAGWGGDGMFLTWDGRDDGSWTPALEGAAAVINLAGRGVNCRHTPSNRREIMESRIQPTVVIGRAVARCKEPPAAWINAGTAAWYRHAEDRAQDEWRGEPGDGFSCDIARAWEEAFFAARVPGETRKIVMRIGMVLGREPGTVVEVLRRLVRVGLGGTMGTGNQRVSWIHLEDLMRATEFLLAETSLDGVFNLTATSHPTNREMMRAFRDWARMPVGLPAGQWLSQCGAILMRTEAELMLKSRWADPLRLRDEGFRWKWPDLPGALADLTEKMGLEGFFPPPATGRSLGVRPWSNRPVAAALARAWRR